MCCPHHCAGHNRWLLSLTTCCSRAAPLLAAAGGIAANTPDPGGAEGALLRFWLRPLARPPAGQTRSHDAAGPAAPRRLPVRLLQGRLLHTTVPQLQPQHRPSRQPWTSDYTMTHASPSVPPLHRVCTASAMYHPTTATPCSVLKHICSIPNTYLSGAERGLGSHLGGHDGVQRGLQRLDARQQGGALGGRRGTRRRPVAQSPAGLPQPRLQRRHPRCTSARGTLTNEGLIKEFVQLGTQPAPCHHARMSTCSGSTAQVCAGASHWSGCSRKSGVPDGGSVAGHPSAPRCCAGGGISRQDSPAMDCWSCVPGVRGGCRGPCSCAVGVAGLPGCGPGAGAAPAPGAAAAAAARLAPPGGGISGVRDCACRRGRPFRDCTAAISSMTCH